MPTITGWGEGGYDPSKPNNNLIVRYEIQDAEPTQLEKDKESALNKLSELGLTEAEINALLNQSL